MLIVLVFNNSILINNIWFYWNFILTTLIILVLIIFKINNIWYYSNFIFITLKILIFIDFI